MSRSVLPASAERVPDPQERLSRLPEVKAGFSMGPSGWVMNSKKPRGA